MKTSSSIAALSNRVAKRAPWEVREANKHALGQLETVIRKEVTKWLREHGRHKIKSLELRPWDSGDGGQWRVQFKMSLFGQPPYGLNFWSEAVNRATSAIGYKPQSRGSFYCDGTALYMGFERDAKAREDFLDSLDPAEAAALRELDEMGVW